MASLEGTRHEPNKVEEEEEQSYLYAVQFLKGFVLNKIVHVAMELNVFEILAKAGPMAKLSASEIATQIPTRNPNAPMMLDRIFKLFVSHSLVDCSVSDGETLYGLNPISKYFVRDQDGGSLSDILDLSLDKVFIKSWSRLKDAIVEGGVPFHKAHGMHLYEYPSSDPRFNGVFNKAMFSQTCIAMRSMLGTYKGFEQLKQLVDVGGGLGITLNMITSRYPHIKGINFDLPHVIQEAPSYPGIQHISGDMFETVLPKGDAILLKCIIHNWSDDRCLKLLKNCYNAIPINGKIIVIDHILPTVPENNLFSREAYFMDAIMLGHNQLGGKERTKQEFVSLAMGAGFRSINFASCVRNFSVMEFFK